MLNNNNPIATVTATVVMVITIQGELQVMVMLESITIAVVIAAMVLAKRSQQKVELSYCYDWFPLHVQSHFPIDSHFPYCFGRFLHCFAY